MEFKKSVNILNAWQFKNRNDLGEGELFQLFKLVLDEDKREVLQHLPKANQVVKVRIVTKNPSEIVYCGDWFVDKFLKTACSDHYQLYIKVKDGDVLGKGSVLMEVTCTARDLFIFERPLLNLLMFTCGLSTKTRNFVSKMNVKVLDTRKTLPGLRVLSKYASFVGGAFNHRWNFEDMVMLKDTHRLVYKNNLLKLIEDTKRVAEKLPICVEVESLEDLDICIQEQIPWVMLDNVSHGLDPFLDRIKKAPYELIVEISGNIDEKFSYLNDYDFFVSSSQVSYLPEKIDLSLKVYEDI